MGAPHNLEAVERESRERIEEDQRRALRRLLETIEDQSKFYKWKMKGMTKRVASDLSTFHDLPPIGKADLLQAQTMDSPWGGMLTGSVQHCSLIGFTNAIAAGIGGYQEVHLCANEDDMRARVEAARRALATGGAGPGERTVMVTEVARSILHHAFLGALVELGSTPFQTGRGLTLRHVRHTLPALRPTQVLTHPTYARHLAALLDEEGIELPVERLFLWGEVGPSVPPVRRSLQEAWGGAEVRDVYAAEELGVLASECEAGGGLHCLEDHFLYEVLQPETAEPVGEGERGELVVTTLRYQGMPMIRYRTGDIVEMREGDCACGRTHRCLRVLGRIFQGYATGGPVDLAAIEEALAEVEALDGHYRVMAGHAGFVLEASAAPDFAPEDAQEDLDRVLKEREMELECRVLPEMARFYHRATRIVDQADLGLWQALVEEQRRLEE